MSDTDDVERMVSWFYRFTIKHPPDTITELAAESGVPEATVEAGIAEAKSLLDRVGPELFGVPNMTAAELEAERKRHT